MTPRVELPIINEGIFLTLLLANSKAIEKASKSQVFFGNGTPFRRAADIVRKLEAKLSDYAVNAIFVLVLVAQMLTFIQATDSFELVQ